jgi:phosphopentomutase
MVTADHGCDPTYPGTDHTREYIPLVIAGASIRPGTDLGIRRSFADIGATVFEYLTGETWTVGESFLGTIRKEA